MQTINVSNILNKLKTYSNDTDILIHNTNEQEKIKQWVLSIKETVNSIVEDSFHEPTDNTKDISKSVGENACIPDLVKLLKEETNVGDKHRLSTWLAEAQKDHVKHNRKSRQSLRKIVLGKKSGNRWEVSKSEPKKSLRSSSNEQLKRSQERSLSKSNNSSIINERTPKIAPDASASLHSRQTKSSEKTVKTSEVQYTEPIIDDSHFTPAQSIEVLAPNTCETPITTNKKPFFDRTQVIKGKRQLSVMKSKIEGEENIPDDGNKSSTSSDKFVTPENKIDKFYTPSDKKIVDSATSADIHKKPISRKKRKSSIQLTKDHLKKVKSLKSESQELKSSSKVYENHGRRGKACNTSAVIPAKISGISSQQLSMDNEKRILREIQKKEEIVNQNTKKIKSLRQQKIEENKKTREMKMEKAMQQRIKMEKEKEERLRCRTLSKQQENMQQKGSAQKKTNAKRVLTKEEETNSAKKIKTPSTHITSVSPTKCVPNQNGSTSTKKAPPKPVRTPAKKAKVSPESQILKGNQTFTMNTNKDASNSDKDVFAKPNLNTTYVGSPVNKSSKVLASTPNAKKVDSKVVGSKTPYSNPQKLNSYAVTPNESSFVSYDVSEIKSDDDDEEEEEVNRKPIPSWATGVQLRNTLLNQHYNSNNIDTDKLFGNHFETPDLEKIMGVQKKHYFKRTSSAIWLNSPNRSILA